MNHHERPLRKYGRWRALIVIVPRLGLHSYIEIILQNGVLDNLL